MLESTSYYAVAFHYIDEMPHSNYEAWVSIGKEPEEGSLEDEMTMCHLSLKEWEKVLTCLKAKKPCTVNDIVIMKIVGADRP